MGMATPRCDDDMIDIAGLSERFLRAADVAERSRRWIVGAKRDDIRAASLSCEILRAFRIHSAPLALLSAAALLYLQLPAARRFHPMVDPHKVMARLRVRRSTLDPR